ncbi:exonuclease SbcCD subunit D [Chloroflexota bacterium]
MKIIHFADLHLGVESYGHIDSATGLSSRLLDILSALNQVVEFAITNKVDLIIFCGDTYKSREPTQTQQREFAKQLNRLVTHDIPIFLLVGNHDMPNSVGRATTVEIFNTLSVKNVYVSSHPGIQRIPTKNGIIQIVSLPWLRRSTLLAKEETKNLNFEQINQKAQEVLTDIIIKYTSDLDPKLPSLLAAHVWVSGAKVGSESSMTIGKEHVLLLSSVANSAFDYVALGHIHKHQVLANSPPVVYAGSLERLDFSDEDNDKGFYLVNIETNRGTGNRQTDFQFHPIAGRCFLTIQSNIESNNIDPMTTILTAITQQETNVKEAIVRLNISLPLEMTSHLRDNDIRNALKEAHYFTIAKDIKRESRLRLGKWTAEEITPINALKAYLETKNISPKRTKLLLEFGEKLIQTQVSES